MGASSCVTGASADAVAGFENSPHIQDGKDTSASFAFSPRMISVDGQLYSERSGVPLNVGQPYEINIRPPRKGRPFKGFNILAYYSPEDNVALENWDIFTVPDFESDNMQYNTVCDPESTVAGITHTSNSEKDNITAIVEFYKVGTVNLDVTLVLANTAEVSTYAPGSFAFSVVEPTEPPTSTSTSGEGDGQDTTTTTTTGDTACNVDGEYFVCETSNVLTTQEGEETKAESTIRCLLDPAIGFDFQNEAAQDCTCEAVVTDSSTGTSKTCNCSPCSSRQAQTVSLDCSNNPDVPFVVGTCVGWDCDARCTTTDDEGEGDTTTTTDPPQGTTEPPQGDGGGDETEPPETTTTDPPEGEGGTGSDGGGSETETTDPPDGDNGGGDGDATDPPDAEDDGDSDSTGTDLTTNTISPEEYHEGSIMGILSRQEPLTGPTGYSTLITLLQITGLDELLNVLIPADGVYTLYAPNNAAFDKLNQDLLDTWLSAGYEEYLRYSVGRHIVPNEAIPANEVRSNDIVGTLASVEAPNPISGSYILLNGPDAVDNLATIISPDNVADTGTGVWHGIDTVLRDVWSWGTHMTYLEGQPRSSEFTILVDLLRAAESSSTTARNENANPLLGDRTTLFAPSNDAFNYLFTSADLEALKQDEAALTALLKAHIAEGNYPTSVLKQQSTITMTDGLFQYVDDFGDQLGIGNGIITSPNIYVQNGLVHEISAVLEPDPTATPSPEPDPTPQPTVANAAFETTPEPTSDGSSEGSSGGEGNDSSSSSPAPTIPGETRGPTSDCTIQEIPVSIDLQINFTEEFYEACPEEEDISIARTIAETMQQAFPAAVNFPESVAFDYDQEVNNLDPFADDDGIRVRRKIRYRHHQRGRQRRWLEDEEPTQQCPDRSVGCDAHYCRWGCITAESTNCDPPIPQDWSLMEVAIQESVVDLGYPCLGISEDLRVVLVDMGSTAVAAEDDEPEDDDDGGGGGGDGGGATTTSSPAPTPNNDGKVTVNANFVLRNQQGLVAADLAAQENGDTLNQAFEDFVIDLVFETETNPPPTERRRELLQQHYFQTTTTTRRRRRRRRRRHRELVAVLDPGSSEIFGVTDANCPSDAPSDSLCQTVLGQFDLLVANEEPSAVSLRYEEAVDTAITDGRLQASFDKIDPNYPFSVNGVAEVGTPSPTVEGATTPPTTEGSGGGVATTSSPAPTMEGATPPPTVDGTDAGDGTDNTPAPTIEGATSPPTVSGNTLPPTTTEGLSSGIFPVRTQFLVSNLESISDEITIRVDGGLEAAWTAIALQLVQNVTEIWEASTGRSNQRFLESEEDPAAHHMRNNNNNNNKQIHTDKRNRFLEISSVTHSKLVTSVTQTECAETDNPDATCHSVEAEYKYAIFEEEFIGLNNLFYTETERVLRDGTFQQALEQVNPDTPLVVGNIPRDAGGDTAAPTTEDETSAPTGTTTAATTTNAIFGTCTPETLSRDDFPISVDYSMIVDRNSENGGFFTAQVTYEGLGWVAIAFSPDGRMGDSLAVIGLPDEFLVAKYNLNGYSSDLVTLADDQTLVEYGTVVQNETHTVMTFTKFLVDEGDAIGIYPDVENYILLAGGRSNLLEYHEVRGNLGGTMLAICEETGGDAGADDGPASGTEDMVYFFLQYEFSEGWQDRGPTQQEVEDLICKTNLYFGEKLQNFTGDNSIQSEAISIDWSYDTSLVQPVTVAFFANATTGDGSPVPIETVLDALAVTRDDIMNYIANFLWVDIQESVFRDVVSVEFFDNTNIVDPAARLESVTCYQDFSPGPTPGFTPSPTSSGSAFTFSPTPANSGLTSGPTPFQSFSPGPTPSFGSGFTISPTPANSGFTSGPTPYQSFSPGPTPSFGSGSTIFPTPAGSGFTAGPTPYQSFSFGPTPSFGSGFTYAPTPANSGFTSGPTPYQSFSPGPTPSFGSGSTFPPTPAGSGFTAGPTPYQSFPSDPASGDVSGLTCDLCSGNLRESSSNGDIPPEFWDLNVPDLFDISCVALEADFGADECFDLYESYASFCGCPEVPTNSPTDSPAASDDDTVSTKPPTGESFKNCTACDGSLNGDDTLPGGLSCSNWRRGVSLLEAGSADCLLARALGAEYCGCDAPEEPKSCHPCPGKDLDATKELPDARGLTCASLESLVSVDADTCDVVAQKYSAWCGCDDAPNPVCAFCEGGFIDSPFVIPAKEELTFYSRIFGHVANSSCQGISDYFSVQTESSCESAGRSLIDKIPYDMKAWCGCPNSEPPNVCGDFCPSGTNLQKDVVYDSQKGLKCGELAHVLKHVTDEKLCGDADNVKDICCLRDKVMVDANFVLTNPDGLGAAELAGPEHSKTLNAGFEDFVTRIVNETEAKQSQRLLRSSRHLLAKLLPHGTKITAVQNVNCSQEVRGKDSTCQNVFGEFALLVENEEPAAVSSRYEGAVETGITDGKLQFSFYKVDPDFPFSVVGVAGTDDGKVTVNASFVVANQEGLRASNLADLENGKTLNQAFDDFVITLVHETEGTQPKRFLHSKRQLLATLEPDSSKIFGVQDVNCPSEAPANSMCQNAYGQFDLLVQNEEPSAVSVRYEYAVDNAIENGKLQASFDKIDPNYPFSVVGVVETAKEPASKKDGKMTWWLIMLIVLSSLFGCIGFGCLFAYAVTKNKEKSLAARAQADEEAAMRDASAPLLQANAKSPVEEMEDSFSSEGDLPGNQDIRGGSEEGSTDDTGDDWDAGAPRKVVQEDEFDSEEEDELMDKAQERGMPPMEQAPTLAARNGEEDYPKKTGGYDDDLSWSDEDGWEEEDPSEEEPYDGDEAGQTHGLNPIPVESPDSNIHDESSEGDGYQESLGAPAQDPSDAFDSSEEGSVHMSQERGMPPVEEAPALAARNVEENSHSKDRSRNEHDDDISWSDDDGWEEEDARNETGHHGRGSDRARGLDPISVDPQDNVNDESSTGDVHQEALHATGRDPSDSLDSSELLDKAQERALPGLDQAPNLAALNAEEVDDSKGRLRKENDEDGVSWSDDEEDGWQEEDGVIERKHDRAFAGDSRGLDPVSADQNNGMQDGSSARGQDPSDDSDSTEEVMDKARERALPGLEQAPNLAALNVEDDDHSKDGGRKEEEDGHEDGVSWSDDEEDGGEGEMHNKSNTIEARGLDPVLSEQQNGMQDESSTRGHDPSDGFDSTEELMDRAQETGLPGLEQAPNLAALNAERDDNSMDGGRKKEEEGYEDGVTWSDDDEDGGEGGMHDKSNAIEAHGLDPVSSEQQNGMHDESSTQRRDPSDGFDSTEELMDRAKERGLPGLEQAPNLAALNSDDNNTSKDGGRNAEDEGYEDGVTWSDDDEDGLEEMDCKHHESNASEACGHGPSAADHRDGLQVESSARRPDSTDCLASTEQMIDKEDEGYEDGVSWSDDDENGLGVDGGEEGMHHESNSSGISADQKDDMHDESGLEQAPNLAALNEDKDHSKDRGRDAEDEGHEDGVIWSDEDEDGVGEEHGREYHHSNVEHDPALAAVSDDDDDSKDGGRTEEDEGYEDGVSWSDENEDGWEDGDASEEGDYYDDEPGHTHSVLDETVKQDAAVNASGQHLSESDCIRSDPYQAEMHSSGLGESKELMNSQQWDDEFAQAFAPPVVESRPMPPVEENPGRNDHLDGEQLSSAASEPVLSQEVEGIQGELHNGQDENSQSESLPDESEDQRDDSRDQPHPNGDQIKAEEPPATNGYDGYSVEHLDDEQDYQDQAPAAIAVAAISAGMASPHGEEEEGADEPDELDGRPVEIEEREDNDDDEADDSPVAASSLLLPLDTHQDQHSQAGILDGHPSQEDAEEIVQRQSPTIPVPVDDQVDEGHAQDHPVAVLEPQNCSKEPEGREEVEGVALSPSIQEQDEASSDGHFNAEDTSTNSPEDEEALPSIDGEEAEELETQNSNSESSSELGPQSPLDVAAAPVVASATEYHAAEEEEIEDPTSPVKFATPESMPESVLDEQEEGQGEMDLGKGTTPSQESWEVVPEEGSDDTDDLILEQEHNTLLLEQAENTNRLERASLVAESSPFVNADESTEELTSHNFDEDPSDEQEESPLPIGQLATPDVDPAVDTCVEDEDVHDPPTPAPAATPESSIVSDVEEHEDMQEEVEPESEPATHPTTESPEVDPDPEQSELDTMDEEQLLLELEREHNQLLLEQEQLANELAADDEADYPEERSILMRTESVSTMGTFGMFADGLNVQDWDEDSDDSDDRDDEVDLAADPVVDPAVEHDVEEEEEAQNPTTPVSGATSDRSFESAVEDHEEDQERLEFGTATVPAPDSPNLVSENNDPVEWDNENEDPDQLILEQEHNTLLLEQAENTNRLALASAGATAAVVGASAAAGLDSSGANQSAPDDDMEGQEFGEEEYPPSDDSLGPAAYNSNHSIGDSDAVAPGATLNSSGLSTSAQSRSHSQRLSELSRSGDADASDLLGIGHLRTVSGHSLGGDSYASEDSLGNMDYSAWTQDTAATPVNVRRRQEQPMHMSIPELDAEFEDDEFHDASIPDLREDEEEEDLVIGKERRMSHMVAELEAGLEDANFHDSFTDLRSDDSDGLMEDNLAVDLLQQELASLDSRRDSVLTEIMSLDNSGNKQEGQYLDNSWNSEEDELLVDPEEQQQP